ncbi:MAG TPA: IMP dehydrogenase [Candidatus Omnitrophota bacterium]|nr:IMP dehydrogenase [Candidatus Omnitrophota bacterium]HPS20390.1 IMP dehydrogenase [Candidatus Omnitrophota bacterium]
MKRSKDSNTQSKQKLLKKRDAFFKKVSDQGIALTYDDVRLTAGYSSMLPDDINVESRFSKNVGLKIPIVSAAMDTVTKAEMAIEIAKLGGIGVIHKNFSAQEQASQVAKVKFHLNGLIEKPICFDENTSIGEILAHKKEKDFAFHSFPIINSKQCLVGILTKNDFDFCVDHSLKAKQIMTKQVITGTPGMGLREAYRIMEENKKKVIPLVDKDGKIAGLYTFSDVKRILFGDSKTFNVDESGRLRVAAAVGVYDDAFERVEKLINEKIDLVIIDTAHGDSKGVIETLKALKKKYNIDILAGNISEPESAERLCRAGADGLKVGQGPGSICTTRIIAGIGKPQVSAIYECAKVASKFGVPVCADGGLKFSGDIPIAIGAGAHSVMMGNMLAGTKESPGEFRFHQGVQYKVYRGMGSLGAMESNKGSRERYNQGKNDLVPEGMEGMVPYKGPLKEVLYQYIGGLKRGMGYVGAENIEDLRTIAQFVRITEAGKAESHPHDIIITREAPNYQERP